jgi:hypothetical protein
VSVKAKECEVAESAQAVKTFGEALDVSSVGE